MSYKTTEIERKRLEDEKARLDAEIAEMFEDPAFRKEIAQEISETIYEGFTTENMVDLYTTTEYLPRNGRSVIREVRGLKAFHVSRGGYIEESFLHAEVTEIGRDMVGFHLVEHTDRLEEGFAETAADLVRLGRQRLDAEINKRVLGTVQAAIPSSSPYYTATAGLTIAQVNDAIAEVQDSTEEGSIPVIVGRATMIRKIEDLLTNGGTYTGFTPETNEDLLKRGVLGVYRGVRLIQLKNYLDENKQSYFPGNELWVLGEDLGKTAFFGMPKTKNFIEDDADYWHYIYRMEYGTTVVRPDRARRIVDSSVLP
jgi:hypothetical protein